MAKFLFLHSSTTGDSENHGEESMAKMMAWFNEYGDKVEDNGNPLSGGKRVVGDEVSNLTGDLGTLNGYMLVNAVDINEAIAIAKAFPSSGMLVLPAIDVPQGM